jgi:hypothetical protein
MSQEIELFKEVAPSDRSAMLAFLKPMHFIEGVLGRITGSGCFKSRYKVYHKLP